MTRPLPLAALALAACLLMPALARAGEGHDHGDAPAGPALPRFTAASDTFELVGVLAGTQITLYLDRSADNQPVTDAQIELDIAGTKFKAQPHGPDTFEVVLAEAPRPGVLPVTATIRAGQETDLLAGEFDLHADEEEGAHSSVHVHAHAWYEYASWGVGGMAVLALLALAVRHKLALRRPQAQGSAA